MNNGSEFEIHGATYAQTNYSQEHQRKEQKGGGEKKREVRKGV